MSPSRTDRRPSRPESPPTPSPTFRFVSAASPEAAELVSALDLDLTRRYPGEPINGIDAAGFEAAGGRFAVAESAGALVGCGALRPVPGTSDVELKRMYVAPEARGRGIARALLAWLEEAARDGGAHRVILETGDRQPEAIALYAAAGYEAIPVFGHYAAVTTRPRSRCFAKALERPYPGS